MKMFEDKFSCIKCVVQTVHIALPSVYVSNEIAGVIEILESWKRQYVQQLKAIVVNYKNVSLVSNSGFIVADKPYSHYDVKATFDLFYPTVGSIVKGTINRISLDHIGCLVHSTINVTIHLSSESSEEISGFIQLDREILFQVTHFDFQRKIVRVKGKITPECISLMKDLYPYPIANKTPDSSISTHLSNIEVTAYSSKKKKKKKLDKSFDFSSSSEYMNYIAPLSESNAHSVVGLNLESDATLFSNAETAPFITKKKGKKSKRDKYLDLNSSAENVTSGISSAESNVFGDNVKMELDSLHFSNLEEASLHSKSLKKKKKHESSRSIDSELLSTKAINPGIPLIESNTFGLNMDDKATHLSCVETLSFNSKSTKKKKHGKSLASDKSMESLHNDANSFNTPVIKNSTDDFDTDFKASLSYKNSEVDSLLSDAETVNFSNLEVASLHSKSLKKKKKHESSRSIDSELLSTKAKNPGIPLIESNTYGLNMDDKATQLSCVETLSFNSKSTKKKKKQGKSLASDKSMESLHNDANSFNTPVIKNSTDDFDTDFKASLSYKNSEVDSLLSDAETVNFSTHLDSRSSKKNTLSFTDDNDFACDLLSKKKKQVSSPSLLPEELIKSEKKYSSSEDTALLTAKSLKEKKHKAGNFENSAKTSKISDPGVFTSYDHEMHFQEVKKEPEEIAFDNDKALKSANKSEKKRKRELSLSENPTSSSPKKKKSKHDKKKSAKKSLKHKKEKGKPKKKNKHKKGPADKSQKAKKKLKKGKGKKKKSKNKK